jgi:hypothetical protein
MSFPIAAEVVCVSGKGAITASKTKSTHKHLRHRQVTDRDLLKDCLRETIAHCRVWEEGRLAND